MAMDQKTFDHHVGKIREAFAYLKWTKPLWHVFKHEMELYAYFHGLNTNALEMRH